MFDLLYVTCQIVRHIGLDEAHDKDLKGRAIQFDVASPFEL